MLGRVADVNIHRSQALAEVQFRHLPLLKITKKLTVFFVFVF